MKRGRRLVWGISLLLAAALGFGIYASNAYPASEAALVCLEGSAAVRVEADRRLVALDGPGEADGLVFYPGGRVAPEAYLPLLTLLAEGGVDCYLVNMPFNLAVFGVNRVEGVMAGRGHERWFLAGHSLGGAMAAIWVAGHPAAVDGLILLAAYPSSPLPEDLPVLVLYGSEDGVLNRDRLAAAEKYLPPGAAVEVLPGGNHAGFGDYGEQDGDGVATLSHADQQRWTAGRILEFIGGPVSSAPAA